MGQFGVTKRRWLLSAIRQRKMLLLTNRSRKSQPETEKAVDILERLLKTYSYENDVYMARFIRQNQDNIAAILPGAGSACHDKKRAEFDLMCKEALMILDNSRYEGRVAYIHLTEKSNYHV